MTLHNYVRLREMHLKWEEENPDKVREYQIYHLKHRDERNLKEGKL